MAVSVRINCIDAENDAVVDPVILDLHCIDMTRDRPNQKLISADGGHSVINRCADNLSETLEREIGHSINLCPFHCSHIIQEAQTAADRRDLKLQPSIVSVY